MVKSNASSKSVWAHMGLSSRVRDAETTSAPMHVSENAPVKNNPKGTSTPRRFDSNRDERPRGRLPERPSTSGGPASHSSSSRRRNAEKRETRDDLYFNPLAVHGKGTSFYNFPLPGALPTPDPSPKSSPPLEERPTTARSAATRPSTPQSIQSAPHRAEMNVPHGEIGMALGSPAHPPSSWHQMQYQHQHHDSQNGSYHVPTSRFQTPTPARSPVRQPSQNPSSMTRSPTPSDRPYSSAGRGSPPPPMFPKQKSSRWKVFGGIFGSKPKPQASFYQLQPELSATPQMTTTIEANPTSSEKPSRSRALGRSKSKKGKEKSERPDLSRAITDPVPMIFNLPAEDTPKSNTPEIRLDEGALDQNMNVPGGMLDVDIPSIHMERYSVMFGSVLQKPSSGTASALLARRQATLDKLKTVNAELASKEEELNARATKLLKPRRATSPQPTKSPAFSLFPNTNSPRNSSSTARPSLTLQRSNTSPAALSPLRPNFAPNSGNSLHQKLITETPPDSSSSSSPKRSAQKSEGGGWPKMRKWEQEKSALVLDSPESMTSSPSTMSPIHNTAPIKPTLTEPHWNMVSRPPLTHAATSNGPTNGSASHATHPSVSSSTTSSSTTTTTTATAVTSNSSPKSPVSPGSIKNFARGSSHIALQKITPTSSSKQRSTTSPETVQHQGHHYTQSHSHAQSQKSANTAPQGGRARAATHSHPHSPQIPVSRNTNSPKPILVQQRSHSGTTTSQKFSNNNNPNSSNPNIPILKQSQTQVQIKSPTQIQTKTSISPPPQSSQPSTSHLKNKKSITASLLSDSEDYDEHEARLKSLADVSIARQISVSRKQRQLLFIKTGAGKKSVFGSSATGNMNGSSSSLNAGGSPGGGPGRAVQIESKASPLSALSTATKEEIARKEDPERRRLENEGVDELMLRKERLVEGRSGPNLPVVVVVPGDSDNDGNGNGEGKGKELGKVVSGGSADWTGVGGTTSVSERRRAKELGEIRVGLMVDGEREGGGGSGGLVNRKSERVVLERVRSNDSEISLGR